MSFQLSKQKRWGLHKRQKGRCNKCQEKLTCNTTSVDHMIPQVLGGTNGVGNLQLLCVRCNGKKANNLPETINWKILNQLPKNKRQVIEILLWLRETTPNSFRIVYSDSLRIMISATFKKAIYCKMDIKLNDTSTCTLFRKPTIRHIEVPFKNFNVSLIEKEVEELIELW